ncbi:MAG: hypothetical protein RSE41_00215 [Clostridia bacterium]
MQTTYIIPIQSFTDIITNSSSETFVVNEKSTKEALLNMLNSVYDEKVDNYSGDCCGVEIQTWDEYIDSQLEYYVEDYECETDINLDEHRQYYPSLSNKEYVEHCIIETYYTEDGKTLDLEVARKCLFIRCDYGYKNARKFIEDNLNFIFTDHRGFV